MNIKIVLIGTSNSLVKNGFKDGFTPLKKIDVTNLSIGGCCAIQHVERMLSHQKVMMDADVIILDSIVNDLVFLMTAVAEKSFILESITAMYEMAASMNKPVFSVLFPTKHHLGLVAGNDIYEHHVSECQRLSIGLIDLFSICKGMKYKELGFLDGPHIAPLFARTVGESLGRFCLNENNLRHFKRDSYQPLIKHVDNYLYSVRNLVVEFKDSDSSNFREKSNRQFSEKLFSLCEPLDVSVAKSEFLGLLQWSDKDSSNIALTSESEGILASSNGLLKFSIPNKPLLLSSKLSIRCDNKQENNDAKVALNNNAYVKTLLCRVLLPRSEKENENILGANHSIETSKKLNVSLLDIQLRKQFAVFMSGIENTVEKLLSLAKNLDDDKQKIVSDFIIESKDGV